MTILLFILVTLLQASIILGAFYLGTKFAQKRVDKVQVTKENADTLKGISEWLNYRG